MGQVRHRRLGVGAMLRNDPAVASVSQLDRLFDSSRGCHGSGIAVARSVGESSV